MNTREKDAELFSGIHRMLNGAGDLLVAVVLGPLWIAGRLLCRLLGAAWPARATRAASDEPTSPPDSTSQAKEDPCR